MNALKFSVPGQPVAKGRPRSFVRAGRVGHHTPEKTVRYENLVAWHAAQAMVGRTLFEGPVQLTVSAWFQIPASWPEKKKASARFGNLRPASRPDADNVLKAVSDAMNGVVYRDDAQAVHVTVIKRFADAPRVDIQVEEIRS